MPVNESTVEKAAIFNESYDRVSKYATDDMFAPYFNPADSGIVFLPGEPVLRQWGASGEEEVQLVQDIIRPGQWGMLRRYWQADFDADFSANVIIGGEVMWDLDNDVVSLAGDVTNGFIIGRATIALPSKSAIERAGTVDGNDRLIVATDASTKVRVMSMNPIAVTTKGTVTIY